MDNINESLHKYFGLNTKRTGLGVRRDIFLEYLPSDVPKDNLVLRNLCKCAHIEPIL